MISPYSYNPCSNCGNEKELEARESNFSQVELKSLDRILGDWDSVDLICPKCGHTWTLILTNESDTQEDINEMVEENYGTKRGSDFWEEGE